VEGQALGPAAVPLFQHLVVCVFLLEGDLRKHLHLLLLEVSVAVLQEFSFLGRGGKGFVEVKLSRRGLLLAWLLFRLLGTQAIFQLLKIPLHLLLVSLLRGWYPLCLWRFLRFWR
jgi:hypothetical protein